jgi:hypothetical protein
MDDADSKKPKPLTPRQRLKNITDALAEDALQDDAPPTKQERVAVERMRAKIAKMVEEGKSEERQKRAKKKGSPGSGYVM